MNDLTTWLGLAFIAGTLFFSTTHFALRDLSRARLGEILERRGKARRLHHAIERQGQLVLATAILRMTANLGLILVVVRLVHPEEIRYVAAFAWCAAVVLIFGVAIPDAWSKYAGQELLAYTLPFLHVCRWCLRPVIAFLYLFDGLVRRLAGVPKSDHATQADRAEQEILEAVSEGERHGAVDEEEREMIESVIELGDKHVGEIMTPRTEVIAIDCRADLREVKATISKEGHSRIPVYEDTIDNVLGVLYAKDLLQLGEGDSFDARRVMRKAPFVPETKLLRDLLHEFQESKVHIAVVLDEYGGTAGLVTIEDILEELVGEITDEYEPPEPEPIIRIDEHTVEVDARAHIDELNHELKIGLPDDEGYETVGGFVFSTLGKIPATGEQFQHADLTITIVDAEERKINRVRLRTTPSDGDG